MNFDQMVIREYLKHNPTLQDAPEVLRNEYKDSKVRGVMRWRNTPEANLYGSAFYNYEIPDLGLMFSGLTVTLHVWKPTTHRDVAKVLFDTYGVIANLDDITPTVMSYNPLPDYVDLVALPQSKTLKGKLRVYTLPKVMPLDELITAQEVDALVDKYPLNIPQLQCIKKYYGYDYSDMRAQLSKQTGWYTEIFPDDVGGLHAAMNLPWVIDEMDAPKWVQSGSGGIMNIGYMAVAYNGPTSGKPDANQKYTHVCVFNPQYNQSDTSEIYSKGNLGSIYFHYNM